MAKLLGERWLLDEFENIHERNEGQAKEIPFFGYKIDIEMPTEETKESAPDNEGEREF